jgi:hypothetical protein
MSCYKRIKLLVSFVSIVLSLTGCGASPTTTQPTAMQPTAIVTSVPSGVTSAPPTPVSTSVPPTPTSVPSTATPTLIAAASQQSPTLVGPIDIGQQADSARITLELSEARTAVAYVGVTVFGPFKCSGGATAGEGAEVTQGYQGPFPITDSNFEITLPRIGNLKGQLKSPAEASGTITIQSLSYLGSCDMGTLNWNATASAAPSNLATAPAGSAAPTAAAAGRAPEPGATFTGSLENNGAASTGTARSGTISFVISKNGDFVTSVTIELVDVKCPSSSSGSLTLKPEDTIPIAAGKIAAPLSGGEIQGQFTSPTEANGSVTIVLKIPLEEPCDLGTWNWSVKAK